MGAYSSWAMLAITHHVIVRRAAHIVGIVNFDKYCILGDDIVINHDLVSQSYLQLMKVLGLSINMNKSVISYDFAEFAKVWSGPNNLNFTPIGPGLILRTIRNKYYIGALLNECVRLSIFDDLSQLLDKIHSLAQYRLGYYSKRLDLAL